MHVRPISAVRGESLVVLPEVPEIVDVDEGRWRIDQVVVSERALVDRIRRAFQPEMPELHERAVDGQGPYGAQLLKGRLQGQSRIKDGMMEVSAENLLRSIGAVALFHDLFVFERNGIFRSRVVGALQERVTGRIVDRGHV